MDLIDKIKTGLVDSNNRYPVIIFCNAIILRLIFLAVMLVSIDSSSIGRLFPDSITYVKAADNLFGFSEDGEFGLFLVGPGYPSIVGLLRVLFGNSVLPILLVQIVLSSLTCCLVYMLAHRLFKNEYLSLTSGLLVAFSITSIELANSILSETTFLFLFMVSLHLYFKAVTENRIALYIYSGLLGGAAVLIRSNILFFPLILLIIALIVPLAEPSENRKRIIKSSIITALIMAAMPVIWSARNLSKYDTFIISGTGIGAARAYLTMLVNFNAENRPQWEFKRVKDSLYNTTLPEINSADAEKYYLDAQDYVIETFKKYPAIFLTNYLSAVLDNVTAVSALHYHQIPRYEEFFKKIERYVYKGANSSVVLIFSLIGFVVLARCNLRYAIILFLIMFYFAIITGVTFWQGSRIFYPAIIAQSILVSAAILFFYDLIILLKNLICIGGKEKIPSES
nr:glycosyltransferase family 39 protein [candidate division Zixibacteria bacterium]